MKSTITTSLFTSAALVPVFGVLALIGLVPLYVYFYFRNLERVAP
jgi:hypothetical protein